MANDKDTKLAEKKILVDAWRSSLSAVHAAEKALDEAQKAQAPSIGALVDKFGPQHKVKMPGGGVAIVTFRKDGDVYSTKIQDLDTSGAL